MNEAKSPTPLVIIDSGSGNLRSVQKALEKSGASIVISNDGEEIRRAGGLILPGVGAFANAMDSLNKLSLAEVIRDAVLNKKKPILGICLGMQLLTEESEEGGRCEGLGLIPAKVKKIDVKGKRDWAGKKLPLPHMGWNEVRYKENSRLFKGITQGSDFYFAHSYHIVCHNQEIAAGWVCYGSNFVCAVESGCVFAVQFHPEKSQKNGARMIANFVEVCTNSTGKKAKNI